MKKYHATAFISGHDHDYERSEPPGGVTVIVSGGARAPALPEDDDFFGQPLLQGF